MSRPNLNNLKETRTVGRGTANLKKKTSAVPQKRVCKNLRLSFKMSAITLKYLHCMYTHTLTHTHTRTDFPNSHSSAGHLQTVNYLLRR